MKTLASATALLALMTATAMAQTNMAPAPAQQDATKALDCAAQNTKDATNIEKCKTTGQVDQTSTEQKNNSADAGQKGTADTTTASISPAAPAPASATGALAGVSIIGVLEAEQTEKDQKKSIRNDRLVGSLQASADDPDTIFSDARDLPKVMQEHIEAYFIEYNRLSGKEFKPLGWHGPGRAKGLVDDGIKKAKKPR